MDILKENGDSGEALKLAVAMALLKSKFQNQNFQSHCATNDNGVVAVSSSNAADPLPPSCSQSDDALKWKRKVF